MNPAQHADNFVGKYQGVYIDEDKAYGSQCWDVVARYAREEYGCPSFPTGSGGAEGLWRLFQQPIPEYFYKVANTDLEPGDIAVWDATFYKPWGHTALVWRREGNTVWVLEQDGSKDSNGDGNADGVAYLVQRAITSKLSGGLRPMSGSMTALCDKTILTKLWVGYAAQYPAPDSYLQYWDGLPVTDVLDWLEVQPIHVTLLKKAGDYDRVLDIAEDRLKTIVILQKQNKDLTAENGELKKALASDGTKLAPGKYVVQS